MEGVGWPGMAEGPVAELNKGSNLVTSMKIWDWGLGLFYSNKLFTMMS